MITHILYFLILTGSAAFFSWLGTALLVRGLPQQGALLDHPGERSNHAVPTPRGGGIAVVGVLIAFLLVASAPITLALALILLAAVSLMDDRKPLPVHWRLAAQGVACLIGLTLLDGPVFQGLLPLWLDRAVTLLGWMWIVNLTNFMDGIDGMTSAETISVGLGLGVLWVSTSAALPRGLLIDGAILAATMLGFARWNRHPAKIFLGDVGSIPLGFVMGLLLLQLAAGGYPAPALILPAYYFLDATLTLLRRLSRGEKIWQAHSEHAYQQAVRKGQPHDAVVRDVIGLNLVLVVLAVVALHYPHAAWVCVGLAYALSLALAAWLTAGRGNRTA